jgi:hypothetical protein
MSAGWVAGSVRARALARRRIGAAEARRLAACRSLDEALEALAATPYGVSPGHGGGRLDRSSLAAVGRLWNGGLADHDARAGEASLDDREMLAAAQHAIAEAVLWDLRVLVGWLPQGGALLMRALAGWYEIANVTERLQELQGRPSGQTFRLGTLATAWPRLQRAATPAEMRAALANSAWKDPGGATEQALEVGLRARWAQRMASLGEPVQTWAAGAVALLFAGERFGAGRGDHPVLRAVAAGLLGSAAVNAATLEELAGRLPRRVTWALDGVRSAADLWRAEAAWWTRAEQDGHRLLTGQGFDQRPVIGAAVVLAADARRVRAALEIAARGGSPAGAFDAVA